MGPRVGLERNYLLGYGRHLSGVGSYIRAEIDAGHAFGTTYSFRKIPSSGMDPQDLPVVVASDPTGHMAQKPVLEELVHGCPDGSAAPGLARFASVARIAADSASTDTWRSRPAMKAAIRQVSMPVCRRAGMPCRQEGMAKSPLARTPSYQALRYWTEDGEAGRSGTDPEKPARHGDRRRKRKGRRYRPGATRTPETPENRCAAILGG